MAGAQPGPQDRASFRLRTCYSQRPLLEWPGYAWRSLCAPLRTVRGTAPEVATWADHAPTPGVAHSGRQVLSLPDTILDVRRSARSRGLSPTSVLVAAAVRACHETWGSERDLPARVYVPVAIMAPEPTTLQNHVVSVSADLPSEDLAHMRLVEDHMEATLSEDTLSATALTTMTRFVVPSLLPPLLRELLARTHLRSTTNRRESLVVTWMRVAGDTLPSFPDATVADVNAWAHTHTPPGLRMMLVSGPRHNLCLTYSGTTIDPDSAGEALERTARHLLAS